MYSSSSGEKFKYVFSSPGNNTGQPKPENNKVPCNPVTSNPNPKQQVPKQPTQHNQLLQANTDLIQENQGLIQQVAALTRINLAILKVT